MKRPKKRYATADQILEDIQKVSAKINELHASADKREALMHRLYGTEEWWRCDELAKDIHRLRVKATNLTAKRLPMLGDKLSTLRTPLLVKCDGEDGSICA